MTQDEFERGWAVLRETFARDGHRESAVKRGAYYGALRELSAEEWSTAVRRCVATCRWFPVPAELLQAHNEAGQPARGTPEAEAARVFELVARGTVHELRHVGAQKLRCWVCRPHEGDEAWPDCSNCRGVGAVVRRVASSCDCSENIWDARLIRERLGDAAAQAFTAAGGQGAFAHLSASDPFIRKRFTEAYIAAVTVRRDGAVPLALLAEPRPEPQRPQLPPPSREEASVHLGRIRELVAQSDEIIR